MTFFDTGKQRAALAILLLAIALAIAIAPYSTGLLGAPVLYVLFAPLHRLLARKLPARPQCRCEVVARILRG